MDVALAGFLTGLSLIIAIGAQNAYVLRLGLARNHVFLAVAICASADALLIAAGVGGLGVLVQAHGDLLTAFALVGAGDPAINGGNNINFTISETFRSMVLGANSKSMTALCRDAGAHLGIQVGSKYACVRIANLTADSGKGLTDALLEDAMALFPSAMQPTVIAMSRRSRKQLRKSRTTYSPTGSPAPNPIEFDGVPIYVTDSIIDTETLLS